MPQRRGHPAAAGIELLQLELPSVKPRLTAMKRPKQDPSKDKSDAYAKALGLLVRREQSERELETRLNLGGYAKGDARNAIDILKSRALQSDSRFADMLARSRAGQGYGPRRIAAELRSHGIADAAIAAVIASQDCDWGELAQRQLRRRYGRKPAADTRERARRAAFLLRRGFDAATVSAITRADFGDPGDEFD
jgi:regulatory protein